MNKFKAFFSKVAVLFSSAQAQMALNRAADLAAEALPFIDIASQIVAGLTATTLDDQELSLLKQKYPQLFDGSITSGDQLKLFAFGAAADLLQQKYPGVTTSIARLAVQAAYTGKTA